MRVIGVRAGTDHLRHAVLEMDASGQVQWLNAGTEHRWVVPKAADTKPAKLHAVHKEFVRLLDLYKPNKVVLKVGETVRGGPSPERVGIEAVVQLACFEHHIASSEMRYQQMRPDKATKLNSQNVLSHAAQHVQPLLSGWDAEIADALVVALRELGK